MGIEYKRYLLFDHRAVKYLNEILSKTEANIVISSSWRKIHTLDEIREQFKSQGIIDVDRVVSMTGGSKDGIRGGEIQTWIDNNPCGNFVIIDDDSDMIHLMDHLVLTRNATGLSYRNKL
jgi:hypothetical protein